MSQLTRRTALGGAAVAAAMPFAPRLRAQSQPVIRDRRAATYMSGAYRDISGPGCVVAARQAVQDFAASAKLKVEILQADHQQKADVGLNIARQWFDRDDVDAVTDINNSAIALAMTGLTQEKNKAHLNSGAASSDLTGSRLQPEHGALDDGYLGQCAIHRRCAGEAGAKRWLLHHRRLRLRPFRAART